MLNVHIKLISKLKIGCRNLLYERFDFQALPYTDILEENSASTDASEVTSRVSIIPGLQPFVNQSFICQHPPPTNPPNKEISSVNTCFISYVFEFLNLL